MTPACTAQDLQGGFTAVYVRNFNALPSYMSGRIWYPKSRHWVRGGFEPRTLRPQQSQRYFDEIHIGRSFLPNRSIQRLYNARLGSCMSLDSSLTLSSSIEGS